MLDPKSQHSSLKSAYEHNNHLGVRNLSGRVKLSVKNYENYLKIDDPDIQFRVHNTSTETSVYSPPLWKSTTTSDHENLSPNSRTSAIAKGQRELMEIARTMPESFYELSLTDIVEKPKVESPKLDDNKKCLVDEKNIERKKSVKKTTTRQESKKIIEKRVDRLKGSNFVNGGLFLKMVFPISIRSKGKKKLYKTTSKRVSPKVESLGKSSSLEKDLQKKQVLDSGKSGSVESDLTSTANSSSKGIGRSDDQRINRNNIKVPSGCWSFGLSRKNNRVSK